MGRPEILVEDGKAVVVVETPLLKCPYCECIFCTQVDRGLHLPVCLKSPVNRSRNMWRKSKNGGREEWAFSSEDPQLKTALVQHGKLLMAGFNISLSANGMYFRKVPANE